MISTYRLRYLSDIQEEPAVGRWLPHEDGSQPAKSIFELHWHKDTMRVAFQIYRENRVFDSDIGTIDFAFGAKRNS